MLAKPLACTPHLENLLHCSIEGKPSGVTLHSLPLNVPLKVSDAEALAHAPQLSHLLRQALQGFACTLALDLPVKLIHAEALAHAPQLCHLLRCSLHLSDLRRHIRDSKPK